MTTQFAPATDAIPNSIIRDHITKDGVSTAYDMAWFPYYDGTRLATHLGLRHTTCFDKVVAGTHFMVMCGEVAIKVLPAEYPSIKRSSI